MRYISVCFRPQPVIRLITTPALFCTFSMSVKCFWTAGCQIEGNPYTIPIESDCSRYGGVIRHRSHDLGHQLNANTQHIWWYDFSSESIADNIIYMLKHPNEALKMGVKARLDVLNRFNVGTLIDQNIDFYKSVINSWLWGFWLSGMLYIKI